MIDWYIGNRAIKALTHGNKFKYHVKNWRPHILAVCPYKNDSIVECYPGIFKFLSEVYDHIGLAIYGHIEIGNKNKNDFAKVILK